MRYLADTCGVNGITTNAHASEMATLTVAEQQRSLNITLDEVRGKVPVICGIYRDGTKKAAELAKMAERKGADCLLVFPSAVFDFGSQLRPEMACHHYASIADASALPMATFATAFRSGAVFDQTVVAEGFTGIRANRMMHLKAVRAESAGITGRRGCNRMRIGKG
ncbi:dihydrodipicolinate synthase family protein [Ferviditalea candida]|uniref:Dihydrodipicolinate synthase family protein n=1 Tax=Ferviditalea candida TaxID=3108399 RepID=A0ABU5ZHW6_9BACL|nr:dihydrodipicolinate synthase family protein [Paenibacillaceae bacterium T2]